jgi:hypothetical protein
MHGRAWHANKANKARSNGRRGLELLGKSQLTSDFHLTNSQCCVQVSDDATLKKGWNRADSGTVSGEAPQQPVASRKSGMNDSTRFCDKFAPDLTRALGNVFEKRLIESYISENGTDPVTGEELTIQDLVELKQARLVRPRPPTLTSIPALLSTFQNEWDAIILETYQLKQQLAETRQELSTALYYSDSAEKVIARLQIERDQARDALANISVTSTSNGANGDAMQVDAQGLPDAIVAKIDQTQAQCVFAQSLFPPLLTHRQQTFIDTTKACSARRLGNFRISTRSTIHTKLRASVPWGPHHCS